MAVAKFTNFPGSLTAADLAFTALLKVMPGDQIYFAAGSYADDSAANTAFASQSAMTTELSGKYDLLGEASESPLKNESKVERLKTRSYQLPGKRTNTAELKIIGIGNNQKRILESDNFQNAEITIVVISRDKTRAVVFNGMRWTCDHGGEADKLNEVTISTEFIGVTTGKTYVYKDIA